MQNLSTLPDIPLLITVPGLTPTAAPLVSAERRITPSWTIGTLKAKLEPVTGVPATSQSLRTRSIVDGSWIDLNNEQDSIGDRKFGLRKGSEIEVVDTRPAALRQANNFTDTSQVEKYEMPVEQYEQLDDSVLAWKRKQKLGRFNEQLVKDVETQIVERRSSDEAEVSKKGIKTGLRCRIGGEDLKRGTVRFVGEIEGLGRREVEGGATWVGVEFDEPVGRNDGSAKVNVISDAGKPGTKQQKIFSCRGDKYGGFARPAIVEIGDFPPVDDLDLEDDDMEEI